MLDHTHRHGLTEQDQANLLRAIGLFVKHAIREAIVPLVERIEQLEAKGIEYKGAYQRGAHYRRHDIVVQSSTMWIAISDIPPNEIPGMSPLWVLADKSQQSDRRSPTLPRTQSSNRA